MDMAHRKNVAGNPIIGMSDEEEEVTYTVERPVDIQKDTEDDHEELGQVDIVLSKV